MARKRLNPLDAGPVLAVAGAVVASLTVSDPASVVAVPFLAAVGIALTFAVARTQEGNDRRQFLLKLMLMGVGLRLLLFGLIHATVGPYAFAPDQYTYQSWGNRILQYHSGRGGFPDQLEDTLQLAYPYWNALLFAVFGYARAAPAITNVFFSVWTAIPMYHLGRVVLRGNEAVARWTAGLTVLFPSMLLWSVLNVREAPAILTITITMYFFARMRDRIGLQELLGAGLGLMVLTLFREYLTMLVGGGAVAGVLMSKGRRPDRLLLVGTVTLFALTLAAQSFGFGGTLTGEAEVLQEAQRMREGFQFDAGSAYGQGANVTSVGGAILFLPIGLIYFLFAPFPWAISSMLQAATLPETMIWYTLVPFAWRGMRLGYRHDLRSYTALLAVFVIVTFSYSLVESNIGTAYRHRAQVLPIAFVFCAVGLTDWLATREKRWKTSEKVRREATKTVQRPPFPRGPFVRR